ncbi:hypothetical protein FM038_003370 [Shewanella eurypsychrophilus]|uniref:Uncharacterized protein n=1 Tax=Shewanella eurypsychrophilus TaxID=2593656 RepID=A0ABX6V7S4_9GAMM|nr:MULTISPECIES: hypothetical protein [Shewanella]QFU21279.1 hypothetical protein FS418_04950 [Shewanella sp. YLB-09]QPG56570.1 hypothetical protein FM038_003370 [Shewanella eurypsychrophilus]
MSSYDNLIKIAPQLATELKEDISKRIGTKKNYIVLNPKYSERKLLLKWMANKDIRKADFAKFQQVGDENNYHILNLLSAPELSYDTLKLGLFLFHRVIHKDYTWHFVFSLLNQDIRSSVFGEDRTLYIGKHGLKSSESYRMPIKCLPELLEKHKIAMQSDDLLPMLQTLHDFGFITLTPIDAQHCINTNLPTIDTKCVHIDINRGAITAKINGRWKLQRQY